MIAYWLLMNETSEEDAHGRFNWSADQHFFCAAEKTPIDISRTESFPPFAPIHPRCYPIGKYWFVFIQSVPPNRVIRRPLLQLANSSMLQPRAHREYTKWFRFFFYLYFALFKTFLSAGRCWKLIVDNPKLLCVVRVFDCFWFIDFLFARLNRLSFDGDEMCNENSFRVDFNVVSLERKSRLFWFSEFSFVWKSNEAVNHRKSVVKIDICSLFHVRYQILSVPDVVEWLRSNCDEYETWKRVQRSMAVAPIMGFIPHD